MKDYILQRKLKQLVNDRGYFDNETNLKLFSQYSEKVKSNVPKEDIDERTLLVEGNRRIIFHILKTRTNICQCYEDTDEYSVCMIGLIKSIDLYKVDSGVKFTTFAIKVINNELNMYYRDINKLSNYAERTKIYFDDIVIDSQNDDRPLTYVDYLQDDEDFVQDVVNKDTFENVIKNFKYLTENEQIILAHYYGLFGNRPKTQIEISKILNVCRANISRQYTSAIKKLKVLSINDEELSPQQLMLKRQLLRMENYVDTDLKC